MFTNEDICVLVEKVKKLDERLEKLEKDVSIVVHEIQRYTASNDVTLMKFGQWVGRADTELEVADRVLKVLLDSADPQTREKIRAAVDPNGESKMPIMREKITIN